MDSTALAQLVTNAIGPALPIIYAGGQLAVNKSGDMILEECIKRLGVKGGNKAKALFDKINPKMSASLEKALINVSRNSEDPKAKEELQQEILKLLKENPNFAREIESILINIDAENIGQITVVDHNSIINLVQVTKCPYKVEKETEKQNKPRQYNPSTLPEYSKRLKQFVDENRADELRKALTYIKEHKILLISGVGGVGKSTLARALIDQRPTSIPEPFWFDFNLNQSAKLGDILEKLASYLEAPEISSFREERRQPGKYDIDKLTDELKRRDQIWLFFEDLSTILDDRKFNDKEIELLFYTLRYNTHNTKIIVTSRVLPAFENGTDLLDKTEEEKFHLSGLEKKFAIEYLSSNGLDKVEPEKLEELAKAVDGHPLALKLLVEVVKEHGFTVTLNDLSRFQDRKENIILKARKLFGKLAGEEKELLEYISVYREPVRIEGIEGMFTSKTPKRADQKLMDKSLLETDHNGNYWLHPLVQEFSYDDLEDKKGAHKLAMEYYLSLHLPQKPAKKEDVQSLIEAHYHACMAGEYDQAFDIIFDNKLHNYLNLWGNNTLLVDLYSNLLPENHLGNEILLKDKGNHGAILGNLGNLYRDLGDPRKAIEYHKQALKIDQEIGYRRGEGADFGNLGNAYRDLGDSRKAIEYYKQALSIGRKIEDPRIINFCEQNLREREETKDCKNLDETQSPNGFFKKIFTKIKPKK